MATGGQSSSPQPQGPVMSLKDCPHCGSLCLGPRILPCGHLLCQRCLHRELRRRTAVCPRCEEAIHLPGDQDLTPSQLILQMGTDPVMEQVVLQELERDGDIRCLNCANRKAANVCLDCQNYYCEVCSDEHLKAEDERDHVLRLLPQALQNTSSTASTTPHTGSPSVQSTLSVDSTNNQQSRGVSRDESTDEEKGKEWMTKVVGLLQQASNEQQGVKVTMQSIVSLAQQLVDVVERHEETLDTYQKHLANADVTLSADPDSYAIKLKGSDVSMDVKTACFEGRVCGIMKDYDCSDINKMNTIRALLIELLPAAAAEEKSGSSFTHPPKSTTQTSTATPQTPPTPDDTPTFTPHVDVMTATPQQVFLSIPKTDEDQLSTWIFAIVCLSDDRLVMTDRRNYKVKVMDVKPPHTLSASTDIPEKPRCLAVLPDGLVAMTTYKPLIYLMSVTKTVNILSMIKTVRQYDGIAGHSEGHLIVSCWQYSIGPVAVDVVTRQGQWVRTLTISTQLESPDYFCPLVEQHILVSDWKRHRVFEIDVCSGQVTQTFNHARMKRPRQVCTDSNGNVFMACTDSGCVMVRNRDGKWRQLLTGSQHSAPKKTKPWGVCLTSSGHLVVAWAGPWGDSVVICYEFK